MTTSRTLPRWQLAFPVRHVVIAELVAAAAVLLLARHVWWVTVIAAVPVLAAAGVRYRGRTAVGWVGSAARRRGVQNVNIADPVAVDIPGVGPIGMRFDGQYAVTAIALHGRSFPATVLVPEGVDTADTVPLRVIGDLLRQFGGLELHSIDVVSAGSRVAPDGRYTPRYDEIIGDRPAVGDRRTWLVLRSCPQACLDAFVYRGNVAVAVAAATERVRQAAVRAGCRASICRVEELAAVTESLLNGAEPEGMEERWTHLRIGNDYVTSYRISGEDLTSRLLGDLWTVRSNLTVTTLRLTRNGGEQIQVAGLVRFHTAMPLTHPPLSTLHPVTGHQISALCASLPLGNRAVRLDLSGRPLRRLVVPVGSCGPMIGTTSDGVPLLMPLTDPLKFTRVAIDADFDVVAALLLRATAAGATAAVYTSRPEAWERICDERLSLARPPETRRTPTLVVADGETEVQRLLATTGERGHGLVVTGRAPADCDVVITQLDNASLTVQVGDRAARLAIMRPRNEAQFLK